MGASPSILDPRSVILLAGIMGVMMALVVFFMQRSYPRSIQGLGEWARAPLVAFASTLLFAARGFFPDFLTIVVANFVLFQACILYYAGSQKFLLGGRIQSTALDVLERLIEATYTKARRPILVAANLGVEKMRLLFRLSYDLKCLDIRRYEFAARSLDEIGRLVGGWRKASDAPSAR